MDESGLSVEIRRLYDLLTEFYECQEDCQYPDCDCAFLRAKVEALDRERCDFIRWHCSVLRELYGKKEEDFEEEE